jgi:hypothetical protein
LIANVNNPSVKRLIGNVMKINTGLIKTLKIPSNADAIIIAVAVSTENPFISTEAK